MRLILIAGPSGAGKSHLAKALAGALTSCATIALDSYYLPLGHLTVEERAGQNFDHPDALDWPLLKRQVAQLRRGEAIEMPVYLFDTHTRSAEPQVIAAPECLILEGIHALHRPELRSHATLRIFVSADEATWLQRRIERDQVERGRTLESIIEQVELTVKPMARQYLEPVKQYGDLTIAGDAPTLRSVGQILEYLEAAS